MAEDDEESPKKKPAAEGDDESFTAPAGAWGRPSSGPTSLENSFFSRA
jgi:hypothetical protein